MIRLLEFKLPLSNCTVRDAGDTCTQPNINALVAQVGQGEADIAALKKASKTLDRLLAEQGVDVEEVVADFKVARRTTSTRKKSPAKAACATRQSCWTRIS